MQKVSLKKWFAIWVCAMLVIIIFTQPDNRDHKINTISFETTESAQLYFTNMRSFYYSQTSEGQGMFQVYRLKSLFGDSAKLFIPFAIYVNWRNNEAFIRLDTVHLDTKNWIAVKTLTNEQEISVIAFPEVWNEAQFEFAREIYYALESGSSFSLIGATGTEMPLMPGSMRGVKKTLSDYFRLTGRL